MIAMVKPDPYQDLGVLRRRHDRREFCSPPGRWLLDKHVLSRTDGSQSDIGQGVVRSRDNNNVHITQLNRHTPIRHWLCTWYRTCQRLRSLLQYIGTCYQLAPCQRPGTLLANQSTPNKGNLHSTPQTLPRSLGTIRRRV
jgi:hypothetical protein